MLAKIKNDAIKLLLNLNIEISPNEDTENKEVKKNNSIKKIGRNEKCPCGSGKSLKIVMEIFKLNFFKSTQCFLSNFFMNNNWKWVIFT